MAGSSSTMATRRFMGTKATGCAREVKALESCHFAPQFFAAASLLRPGVQPPLWRNAPVAILRETSMTSLSPHPPATRREMLANWLALLTLLALGIVWPQHADSPQTRVHAVLTDDAAR